MPDCLASSKPKKLSCPGRNPGALLCTGIAIAFNGGMDKIIVRICAACQKERQAILPSVSNVVYSHGACYRHAVESFAEILGEEKARLRLANKSPEYYCPDMSV